MYQIQRQIPGYLIKFKDKNDRILYQILRKSPGRHNGVSHSKLRVHARIVCHILSQMSQYYLKF
jgi:hypothetical protein